MKNGRNMKTLARRFERLKARLAKLEWVLQGTITERFDVRETPKGSGRTVRRGPYYQWTFKRRGKTVTVNLAKPQAKAFQKAIDNHRELEEILRQWRAVSLEFLETTTESVKRRKPLQSPDLPLS